MVTTLKPKARDTPTRPMPTCGNPAAITALPHPAKVSQNVPIASATYFCAFMTFSPGLIPMCGDSHGSDDMLVSWGRQLMNILHLRCRKRFVKEVRELSSHWRRARRL